MAQAEKMTDSIRIRIEPDKKAALADAYRKRSTSISREVRAFLDRELEGLADPLDRFDAIMASADAKLDAYGAPEPTVEDIVSYVEGIRAERARSAVARA